MSELRKDFLLDRQVIVAKERGKRPSDFKQEKEEKEEGMCFFCPGNEDTTPPEISRVEKDGKWVIRNFPNKFPATPWHEIIVETPHHEQSLSDLRVERISKVFEMYSKRIKGIKKNSEVEYVLVFKNRGEEGGASLEHSHTQVIGLEMVPTLVKKEVNASKSYMKKNKSCPFCDLWKREVDSKRKILEDEFTAAFAPYASRFPFEVRIMPKRHHLELEEFTSRELYSLSQTLKKILARLNSSLNDPSYNFYLHVSPDDEDLHFHIELFPRITSWAGFEFGSEVIINVMPPEKAAQHYREGI